MKTTRSQRKPKVLAKAWPTPHRRKYLLRLYVAGATLRSRQAILHARQLCETEVDYELEVIDIYQQPILARDGQILATPTLVQEYPKPVRRFIGNLSNLAGLFVGMALDTTGKTKL